MTIRVARGVAERIRNDPGTIHLKVSGADDVMLATAALRAAATEIAGLDGGWESVDGLRPGDTNGPKGVKVWPVPTGPELWVDGGSTPDDLLLSIPDIVARRLTEVGVTSAVIAVPEPSKLFLQLWEIQRAAFLCLYLPPPPGIFGPRPPLPLDWLTEATDWVAEAADGPLWVWTGTATFRMSPEQVRGSWEQWRERGNWLRVVNTDDATAEIRVLNASYFASPKLGLGRAAATASDADLVEYLDSLIAMARRWAPSAALGLADFGTFNSCTILSVPCDYREGYMAFDTVVASLADELVADSYPYQILGPGHVARFASAGGIPPGAQPVGGGRFELFLGSPESWLQGSPDRTEERTRGRAVLAPCMLTDDEVFSRLKQRRGLGGALS